jgi:hypothetical protein
MTMLFASQKLRTTTVVAAASVRLTLFDLSRASWTNSLGAKRSAEPELCSAPPKFLGELRHWSPHLHVVVVACCFYQYNDMIIEDHVRLSRQQMCFTSS